MKGGRTSDAKDLKFENGEAPTFFCIREKHIFFICHSGLEERELESTVF